MKPPTETRLETADEIRAAIARHQAALASAQGPLAECQRYRPGSRPPAATLTVCDDASEEGELIRLRGDRFVIGREAGDLRIPHDHQISAKHAEIRRVPVKDMHRWQLRDLRSTNGTFVRVRCSVVAAGQEFVVGQTHYRLELPTADPPASPSPVAGGTAPCAGRHPGSVELVELSLRQPGRRHALSKFELWIGTDPDCDVIPVDDPFVASRHARLWRGADGRWRLENNQSINGVWLRMERIVLKGVCAFQLGEQRFVFRAPDA